MTGILASWNDGPAKQAIGEFVERTVSEVPVEERVAVFDNDGTLWCEKPLPIQADFVLRRMHEMADADPGLRERQPSRPRMSTITSGWARWWPSTTRATTRMSARSWAASLLRSRE
jgi:hypothetical protein